MLKFSRRFHIHDTNYNTEFLDQEKFVWGMLEAVGVEAMVRMGKGLGEAKMQELERGCDEGWN